MLATKRNLLKRKSLWQQKVGRSKLIKTRSANDSQHHMCTEMECSHKSLTHTCNVISWECVSVSPASYLLKEQNNLHVVALREYDMSYHTKGVSNLSLQIKPC